MGVRCLEIFGPESDIEQRRKQPGYVPRLRFFAARTSQKALFSWAS